jgi:hypothetical protein
MGTYPARTAANGRHIGRPGLSGRWIVSPRHGRMASRRATSPRLLEERALESEPPVSRPSRGVRYAVCLMVLGAALEVGTAAAALATSNSLRTVFASADAFDAHDIAVVHGQTIAVNCTVAAALWLTMAYANYRAEPMLRASSRQSSSTWARRTSRSTSRIRTPPRRGHLRS